MLLSISSDDGKFKIVKIFPSSHADLSIQISPHDKGFLRIFSYAVTMTIQVFLPCYFGNEVTDASGKLSESLFYINWISQDKSFKSGMQIFMENSKKPIKITAFYFVDIDFTTFTSICNSAYSLYALLKKVNT
jgi:hypothetical protein